MLEVGSNGLPVIQCCAGAAAEHLPIQDLLQLEQQTQTQEDFRRIGLSV